ncbi:MAG: hypothetical protein IJL52_07920 [Clostridia bacterium]|nr:hypothetical protein [Clostridia bacterium]
MKKRITSLLLVTVMLVVMLPLHSIAEGVTPVIVIGGYSSPQIYLFDGNGYEEENIVEKVWAFNLSGVLDTVKGDFGDLTKANLNAMISQDTGHILEQISDGAAEIAKYMRRNPDGSPVYDTQSWPRSAEESNMKYINEHRGVDAYLDKSVREKRFTPILCDLLGEENVYCFSVDWRQNQIECALNLGQYIVKVLDYSGAKKVNIFCESHGGETASSYISLCSIVKKGGDNTSKLAELLGVNETELATYFNLDYLKNVVMDSPAIGVQLAYDIVMGKIHFDAPLLIEYLEYANNPLQRFTRGGEYCWESEWEWLLGNLTLDNLNRLLNAVVQRTDIIEIMLTFGSIWDFIPADKYEEVKAAKLDTDEKREAFAPMIAKSDYDHEVIMANMHENLTFARENGVNVNSIVGTDITCVSGSRVNGDGLVNACDASGAKVAPYGKRFADGYHTDYADAAVTCTDPTHDHVAPRMNLDGAYAYLPENTWFIERQFHAQYVTDSYCLALVEWLLLGDGMLDVYSDPTYPQFNVTHNAKMGVLAQFDKSVYGTATAKDTALVVTNLSAKSKIRLVAIKAEGMDVGFENVSGTKIPVGESVTLKLTGALPDADMKNVRITLYYLEDSSVWSMDSRTQEFTVKGGKAIPYDPAQPLTDTQEKVIFLTAADVLKGARNYDLASYALATVYSTLSVFKGFVSLIQSVIPKKAA